ncbi:hypothetical protein QQ045_010240 [Rhodiola kirilowii]
MFRLPGPRDEIQTFPRNQKVSRNSGSGRILDERFIRILKIFKWGPDAERAVEVLKLKVDHALVCKVLSVDVEVNAKVQFFKWAWKRRNFEHDTTTYMALIQCLDEAKHVDEMLRMIQEMLRSNCVIEPGECSDIVRILGRAKMVNKAISVFYQIKNRKCKGKPTVSTYNSIFFMLMQEGHYEKIHELYTGMWTLFFKIRK